MDGVVDDGKRLNGHVALGTTDSAGGVYSQVESPREAASMRGNPEFCTVAVSDRLVPGLLSPHDVLDVVVLLGAECLRATGSVDRRRAARHVD